jgi:hypothetical protein
MNILRVDDAILSVSQKSWRKVAMIIVLSVKGAGLPNDNEGHQVIASRIKALVQDGRLLAQGNLDNWRRSEVRLP